MGGRIELADIITAKNLCLWYGDTQALKSINIAVPEHSITALIGPSGCGKSTFLKTLNRMNDLVPGVRIEGDVRLRGQDIFAREMELTTLRRRVGMVFQKANPFPMSIYDNITYGPKLHGVKNVLAHAYCYILVGLAIMPQCYVIYSSFRNTSGKLYTDGFGLGSYKEAFSTVGSSIVHTYALAFAAIFVIVLVSLFVSYVVVRRRNVFNAAIDVVSMFPETVMGSILGIALLTTFNKKPLLLTGGAFIMILSYTIRRMPYTIRSSSAILRNISPSIEEASINLGASDFKTFFKVTVPMMMSGVISGAILSWIMIITELSTSIILYTSKTKTMTLEIYSQIIRGNDGVASAISAILTFSTIIALAVFFKVSGKKEITM